MAVLPSSIWLTLTSCKDSQVIFAILVFTLYWKVAKDFDPSNTLNIAAVLFMWTTLPAYGNSNFPA